MSTVATVYGKIRIPTEAHKALIDHAAKIAKDNNAELNVTLSGAAKPLGVKEKTRHASNVLGQKVKVKEKSTFATHLEDLSRQGVEHLHVIAGSDRADKYRKLLEQYNGKRDKSGRIPFNFKSFKVHQFGAERNEGELPSHPSKIKDILPYTSATNVEKFAKAGDYEGFKSFYRNTPEEHVKGLYDSLRQTAEGFLMSFKLWLEQRNNK